MQNLSVFKVAAAVSVAMLLSSCAVTEDSLKASSETVQNTSEATSDFTSSTSHKDDDKGKARDVHDFSQKNLPRLREDMALGSGPYLASLAELLEIDPAQRNAFYQLTKDRFGQLFVSETTSAREMLTRLDNEIKDWRHTAR